jgi:hypothetical protein
MSEVFVPTTTQKQSIALIANSLGNFSMNGSSEKQVESVNVYNIRVAGLVKVVGGHLIYLCRLMVYWMLRT